ncbi:TatD family hydrolase [Parabacteroides sp. PF5-9]|uniref:TatD family hydrolase n=1 Tax=Parabacteroides sp. PF5-9 TaxID=1742404 RepID=UPI0024736734|nr:TatD family hydrolase [Parabacteroides sp. PF5-9]MDH6356334.1 TatD DNase family protein [Parabacteroides sp. PF5-9]
MFYNIHTHQPSSDREERVILNRIVKATERDIETEEDRIGENTYYSYGIHPWYIENEKEQIRLLYQQIQQPHVVAIGEAGLDKLAKTDLPVQERIFTKQAVLAEEYKKPLIIHCVKAWTELIAIKKKVNPHMPWIIHGFRGNKELADQLIKHEFYLSFGARFNPSALPIAWPDRLLAETDDREINIRQVYALLAEHLHLSINALSSRLTENVKHIFLFD